MTAENAKHFGIALEKERFHQGMGPTAFNGTKGRLRC